MVKLEKLILSDNQITALPNGMSKLDLSQLDLSHNRLSILPPDLNDLLDKGIINVTGNMPPLWDPEEE